MLFSLVFKFQCVGFKINLFGDCFLNDGNGSSHFMLSIIMAVTLYENKM